MLDHLLPSVTRLAVAMYGDDVRVSIQGQHIDLYHSSIEGGWTGVDLEDWMLLVAQHLEDLMIMDQLHGS